MALIVLRRISFIVFVLICVWVGAANGSYARVVSFDLEEALYYHSKNFGNASNVLGFGQSIVDDETRTPYSRYADDGVELRFSEIRNIDFRIFLLYRLTHDERFELNAEKENGVFIINSGNSISGDDFFDEFEELYNSTYADFQLLTKVDIGELFPIWKTGVTPLHLMSVLMDITLTKSRNDNDHCINADPFCTSDYYEFESAYSDGEADEDADFGCIGAPRNPSWYFMRIGTAGPLVIHMEGHDPTSGDAQDIDFCLWGPFTEQQVESGSACSLLTIDKIIDCSYSLDGVEDAYLGYQVEQHTSHNGNVLADGNITYHVPQAGEYYLLMITNFSNRPCIINFNYASGDGSTDCTILPPMLENDGPYCVGDDIYLIANTTHNATYHWTGPNGFSSNQQNPTISNCTMANAGLYYCSIQVGNQQSSFANTQVVVYPRPTANFNATTVCQGQATQFTSTSTTDPTGSGGVYQITSYQWNFGDGYTGTGPNPTHTYAQGGDYQVTLTVSTGNGACTDQITMAVHVIPPLNVQVTVDGDTEICDGESVTLHAEFDSVDFHYVVPGDILCTDGSIVKPSAWPVAGKTPKGIVFYVDNTDSHGWAVSLNQSGSMQWCNSTTNLVGTAYGSWRNAIRDMRGSYNTTLIRNAGTSSSHPAAWNPNASQGWYLPSIGQLNVLFGELVAVNASLNRVGGTQITDTAGTTAINGNVYLWSSTEKSASHAYALEVQDGQIGGISKSATTSGKQFVVRAIIDF